MNQGGEKSRAGAGDEGSSFLTPQRRTTPGRAPSKATAVPQLASAVHRGTRGPGLLCLWRRPRVGTKCSVPWSWLLVQVGPAGASRLGHEHAHFCFAKRTLRLAGSTSVLAAISGSSVGLSG